MNIRIIDKSLEQFIESLEKPTVAKILRTIDLLETFGSKLGMPHSRKIAHKIFELRVRSIQEIRILYVFHKESAILLHGFVKKSEQTPKKEIRLALRKQKMLDGK